MFLIEWLKSNLFVQNLVSFIYTRIPAFLEHNLGKYHAIKKAFYLTALDGIDGDYLEFGVFTGSSFVCALRAHRRLKYLGDLKTNFYGFDSFEGFGQLKDYDRHPFYISSIFKVNADQIIKNIYKKGRGLNVKIIKGFFNQTIGGKDCQKDFAINKIRCIFIDCDLKDSTREALNFSASGFQPGTILLFDDFFSFKGDSAKGVAGAFSDFCQNNPSLRFRKVFDYGYGGVAYILSEIKK